MFLQKYKFSSKFTKKKEKNSKVIRTLSCDSAVISFSTCQKLPNRKLSKKYDKKRQDYFLEAWGQKVSGSFFSIIACRKTYLQIPSIYMVLLLKQFDPKLKMLFGLC